MPETHFSHFAAEDMPQLQTLLTTAADIFGTVQEASQIPAELATVEKLQQLSRYAIGVQKTNDGQIVAWCTVFPTTISLMHRFLDGAISERSLFDQTTAGDVGAVYVMSVYIFPELRGVVSPERLLKNTVGPFLGLPAPIFYRGVTEQGARLGALLQKKLDRRGYQILRCE
ncbi:hypothetical protein [Actimicrobium antarcticum]|uniref:hypothetical protein n=1 Tax=Actimicrobium antarcticum TaxID=1051899 RepID=UPI0031D6DAFB